MGHFYALISPPGGSLLRAHFQQPSPYDVWSSVDIIKILQEARSYGANVKAAFVITRKIPNTVLAREVVDALAEYEVPVFSTHIQQRVCYAETAGEGLTVVEMKQTGPSHRQAAEEIRKFGRRAGEVRQWLTERRASLSDPSSLARPSLGPGAEQFVHGTTQSLTADEAGAEPKLEPGAPTTRPKTPRPGKSR